MENKQTKNKKIKLIATGLGASLLLAGTLIGSGFGFAKAVKERGPEDNLFNQRTLIQADINAEDGTTLREVGNYVNETIEFLGINNSKVYITDFDNIDRLIIDIPVSTYITEKDDNDKLIDTFSDLGNNEKFVKEVAKIYATALFNNNLDFRSTTGEQIFVKQNNGFIFDETVLETETENETFSLKVNSGYGDYDFYTKSSISYKNGVPIINVGFEKNNGKNDYLNLFKEFNEYLTISPETSYNIWFGYDQLVEFGTNVTGETFVPEEHLGEKWIKPFYVTTSSSSIMSSRFADKITIQKDVGFNENEAKFYSKKINNTDSFTIDYSSINVSLYMNEKSKVILIVMASILLVVIITIIGLMLWYLGLLGLIASAGFILINLFVALIYSGSGLIVTSIGLIGLIVLAFLSAWMIFIVANKYRKDNDDKYISSFRRYTDKLKGFNREIFSPMLTITILAFVAGLFLPAIIASILYLVVIGNVLAYFMAILIQLSYFGIDVITNFTKDYYDVKWSLMIGRVDSLWNKKINYNDSLSKKRTTIISLSSIIVFLLSVFVGGALFLTTGSSVNTNIYGTQDYYYNVKLIDSNTEYKEFNILSEEGLIGISTTYEKTALLENQIKSSLKEAGIKVKDISLVRNDEITFFPTTSIDESDWNIELVDNATFGFNVITLKSIEDTEKVKQNLLNIGCEINEDFLSMSNGQYSKITNVTDNTIAINAVLMILALILVFSIIALFVSRWGAALTVIITTTIEAIFVYAPLFMLFIPFVQIMLLPIALLMCLSAGVKVYIIRKVKEESQKTENVWIKCTEQNQFLILLVSITFVIMSLFLIPLVGVIYAITFGIYALWIGFVTLITQRYVFTYFARVFTNFNDKVRKNKVSDDITRSKNSDEPQEEYIEGVNM